MPHPAIDSILRDKALSRDIMELAASAMGLPKARQFNITPDIIERAMDPKDKTVTFDNRPLTEAIVLEVGRPVLLVRNDAFEAPMSGVWRQRLLSAQSRIEKSLPAVGRIELSNNPDFEWVGTGWMLTDDVLVTNRHVALTFARKNGSGFGFIRGVLGTMSAQVDFKEEFEIQSAKEISIKQVLFIEENSDGAPDIALMRVAAAKGTLPKPITLHTGKPGQFIAAVGYPARDSRNDERSMEKIFGDIYNVKRLSPGEVKEFSASADFFTHDCSTLGGNSGSVMIDLATGKAVGLHFAGRFRQANFAVKAATVEKYLKKLKLTVPVARPVEAAPIEEKLAISAYADRTGYDEKFLGDKFRVKLPTMTASLKKQVAKTTHTKRAGVLDYMHYSTVMHKGRNLCIYSVVNIDGTKLRRIPGSASWLIDPRVPDSDQTNNDVYVDNDLDRGHMVRRLDPVWGTEEEAKKANRDTFHYSNSCPQVHRFNAGIWNDLEDYLLDNAGAEKLRITVFTGPVLKDSDKEFRSVKLPREYWKVAAMTVKNGSEQQFMAAAFKLSQADDLTPFEAFRLGEGRTEQLPITDVEKLTGLRFPEIRAFDTMGVQEGAGPVVIRRPEDIMLRPVTIPQRKARPQVMASRTGA